VSHLWRDDSGLQKKSVVAAAAGTRLLDKRVDQRGFKSREK
jgi:hypothetical protein